MMQVHLRKGIAITKFFLFYIVTFHHSAV